MQLTMLAVLSFHGNVVIAQENEWISILQS